MKILTPFWFLDVLEYSFIWPQMRSISEQLSSEPDGLLHVVYVDGVPKEEWNRYFSFHKVTMPYGFARSKMARFFLSRGKLYKQIKDLKIDVFFTLSSIWMQEFSRYCSKRMRVPYVVRLRGDHRTVRRAMKVNLLKERILNYLETKSLKEADLIIPYCSSIVEKAEAWGVPREKMTEPVFNGVDTEMFKPMTVERRGDFTIAYAGRISPEKKVRELLQFLNRLSDVRFIVAGQMEMPGIVFPKNVEYMGPMFFSEMPKFYNKADIVIVPYLNKEVSNALLEAYACGKPVLVEKGQFPPDVELFGFEIQFDNFSTKDLEEYDLKKMGQNARAYVKNQFSWKRFAESVVEYLKSVCQQERYRT